MGEEQAFRGLSVAELGQRRAEVAWHPDVTLFAGLGQAQVAYQVEEVVAQAEYDLVERPHVVRELRKRVADAKAAVEALQGLPELAKKAAENGRRVLKAPLADQKGLEGEETLSEEERESREEAEIQELRTKGKLMLTFGWPKAVRCGPPRCGPPRGCLCLVGASTAD